MSPTAQPHSATVERIRLDLLTASSLRDRHQREARLLGSIAVASLVGCAVALIVADWWTVLCSGGVAVVAAGLGWAVEMHKAARWAGVVASLEATLDQLEKASV